VYGVLVATRVAGINRVNTVEIRAVVTLPADEEAAGLTAQGLLTAVHLAITSMTADRPAVAQATTPARRSLPAAAGERRPLAA
jgi:hypothetical protein